MSTHMVDDLVKALGVAVGHLQERGEPHLRNGTHADPRAELDRDLEEFS